MAESFQFSTRTTTRRSKATASGSPRLMTLQPAIKTREVRDRQVVDHQEKTRRFEWTQQQQREKKKEKKEEEEEMPMLLHYLLMI
ncbi:hypothetical protein PINS_up015276 [Pythium insidiosum]|nr:hypothetical protein PINS_up015276 [Pythium insidiosum]